MPRVERGQAEEQPDQQAARERGEHEPDAGAERDERQPLPQDHPDDIHALRAYRYPDPELARASARR